jgi:anti-sigma B factor antagonist
MMKIEFKSKENVEIFELHGEVDFHSSPDLRTKIQEVLKKEPSNVLIKLKNVSYIDSSGLATFVEALQKIKKYQGQLVLSNLAPAVRSVFEIAKLDTIFQLTASEDEARAFFAKL